MRALRSLLSWLRALLRRGRVERELDAELQFHLEQETVERIAAGQSPVEARAAALRSLGSVAHAKDACRDSLGLRLADAFAQDARQTARALLRQPVFALVVIFSLALGIGANSAIFQLINAVRLRTLPVPRPQELVSVRVAGGNRGLGLSNGFNSDVTFALWERIRESQSAFSGVFAWGASQVVLNSGADTDVIDGLWVSGELFPVLGLSPARGRLLTAADDRNGCGTGGAVLNYKYWQRRFGGDNGIIGRTLTIIGKPVPVIGVAPPDFFGLEVGRTFDVALPLCAEATWGTSAARRDVWWLAVMGRLKPDWTVTRASEHLGALSNGLFEATVPPGYSDDIQNKYKGLRLTTTPAGNGSSRLRETYDTPLWLLLGMTAMVLLVACVNLANLMLARATAKQHDIAVRIAIGASRRRIASQFLIEGLVLAAAGGLCGVALSNALSHALIALLNTEENPILVDVSPDWRVLTFTAALAVSTCLLFALIPALRSSRAQPVSAIKDGGRGTTDGRSTFAIHKMLVASQVALSVVLISGAFLFVRSFRNLATIDAGFRQRGIVFMSTTFFNLGLPPAQNDAFRERLLDEVRGLPHVASAALTTYVPLINASWSLVVRAPNAAGEEVSDARFTYVSPRYFETMGTRLLAGRDFNDFDRTDSQRVAIVNETFVRRFIRSASPIGTPFRTVAEPGNPATTYEVIGVVQDTKYGTLRDDTPPMAFVPISQNPDQRPLAIMAIESSVDPDLLVSELRGHTRRSHPGMLVMFRVFERQIQDGVSRERLMAWLAGAFGALAGVLAVSGLYGLLSYIVQRRRHEIGVRVALGATKSDVTMLVLRQTSFLVLIGLAVGLPAWLIVSRSAASLLYGLAPHDAVTVVAAAGLLALIAVAASAGPAWRAARIDPLRALREE